MKKIILLSLLALPFRSASQTLSFGIQGGLNPKTSNKIEFGKTHFASAARVMLGFKHFETGVGFEMGRYAGRGVINDGDVRKAYNAMGGYTLHTTANYYTLYGIGNYKMNITSKLTAYAGIAAGMDIGEDVTRRLYVEHKNLSPLYNPNQHFTINTREHALALGIQSGVRYHINNTFSLQGEVAVRNTRFIADTKYSVYYFPITIGVYARLAGK